MERDPDGQVKTEQRGHVLLIGIDRPEKRNGFTPKLFSELAAAYTRLEKTPDLRCGVVYAEGDHFTAGLDMPKIVPLRRAGKPLIPPEEVDPFSLREPLRTKPGRLPLWSMWACDRITAAMLDGAKGNWLFFAKASWRRPW